MTNDDFHCPCCGATDWHQFPDDCHLGPEVRYLYRKIGDDLRAGRIDKQFAKRAIQKIRPTDPPGGAPTQTKNTGG